MTRQLSIQDAAQHFNVSERTIRRRIKQGTLKADLIDGRYLVHVCVDSDMTLDKPDVNVLSCQLERADFEIQHLTELVEEKTNQILYLRDLMREKDEQIDRFQQLLAMQSKTTAALTEQLDASRQMIEDMRHRSWWKRVFRRR